VVRTEGAVKIQITIRNVYGVERAYPVCRAAQTFAEIAGTKTLEPGTLAKIQRLGYEVEYVVHGVRIGAIAA
jgi:hypothetical protein